MTEDQKTRVTVAFVALLDAAKAVVETTACADATSQRLLRALEAAIYEVDVTCATIALDNTVYAEDRTAPY